LRMSRRRSVRNTYDEGRGKCCGCPAGGQFATLTTSARPNRSNATMIEDLPIVRTALAAHCRVSAHCVKCEHVHELDLDALAERHANTPLIHLPLRCQRCRSRACRVIVSGREPG
jgi:hypothetical protein